MIISNQTVTIEEARVILGTASTYMTDEQIQKTITSMVALAEIYLDYFKQTLTPNTRKDNF